MSADQRPLHMGWVLLLTPILWIAGIALVITPNTQGVWEGYLMTVLLLSIKPALFWVPAGLMWCLLIWTVYHEKLSKKHRALLMFLPPLLMLTVGAWQCVTNPPSPQKFFARHFNAPLPASAHEIKARFISPADPGSYTFFFRSTRADTKALILALGAKGIPFHHDQGIRRMMRVPNAPDVSQWPRIRYFEKTDGKTGTGYIVAANEAFDQVFVIRDPLWSKSDAELAGHDPLLLK